MVRKEMMNLESFCGRTNIQHNSSSADHTRKSVWTQKTGEYLKCSRFYLTPCTPTVQTHTYTHPCLHSNVHFRSLHWKGFSKQLSDKRMPNCHRVTEVCWILECSSRRDSEAWELVVGSPSVFNIKENRLEFNKKRGNWRTFMVTVVEMGGTKR